MQQHKILLKELTNRSMPYNRNAQDKLLDAIGDSQIVLLGEASHGTSEFYKMRAELTKRLIKEKGFTIIAVEGDWPPCYEINKIIKSPTFTEKIEQALIQNFNRWPSWMWANEEVAEFLNWVSNSNQTQQNPVSFYGVDVYSLWESLEGIISYLETENSPYLQQAREAFQCFEPYQREGQNYGLNSRFLEHCEDKVITLLKNMQVNRVNDNNQDEDKLSAELNALVTLHAEKYYREMLHIGPESWNTRDKHMVDVIERIIDFHGKKTKIVIWEHNTHIGDARATDMKDEGMLNVGQLLNEKYNKKVFSVGFGTYHGTVIAADSWGDQLQKIIVPKARKGSIENLFHQNGSYDQLLLFTGEKDTFYKHIIDHRAIGVIYDPRYENYGNYVPSVMAKRYNAFVYVDESNALRPLSKELIYTS
ncbi:erythromycin esterase family protein [Bacillus alkalicellulosilyticus]|uniref:erythromycin esterase family protein n=1 Tax=Alkalihalobacterium alkalicellulosilyticum TaxID=1912214 RepID=UPI001FE53814|nr:erythromycin esterase family protein [Bacillus alkalicellulosilyticus]